MVKEEVAVLIVFVRLVDDEVPGAVEEETGPAAVRRVPQAFWMRYLYMPLVRPASSLYRLCSTRRGSAPGRV